MASIFDRVARFARTPQGRRVIQQATSRAQELSKDPATKAKLERLRAGLMKRKGDRRPPTPPGTPPSTPPG